MGFKTTELRDSFNDAMEKTTNVSQPGGQEARKGRMTEGAATKETGVVNPTPEDRKAVLDAEDTIVKHNASRSSPLAK
jgi:hypothetical protein